MDKRKCQNSQVKQAVLSFELWIGFGAEEMFYILYLPSVMCDKRLVESVLLLG